LSVIATSPTPTIETVAVPEVYTGPLIVSTNSYLVKVVLGTVPVLVITGNQNSVFPEVVSNEGITATP